jgi:hypothetical protein
MTLTPHAAADLARKEGARLYDEQCGTAERGDERQAWPVERERL